MEPKNIVLTGLVVFIIIALGFVVYKGTTQAAIGDFGDKASCEAYATKNFCAGGFYACTPCTSTKVGYTMTFQATGITTDTIWSADCKAKSTVTDNQHTLCGGTSTPAQTNLATGGATTGTCIQDSVCQANSVKFTATNCATILQACPSGTTCTSGVCLHTAAAQQVASQPYTQQPVQQPVQQDLCANVVCENYCDNNYANHINGRCNTDTGGCEYGRVVINSGACLPTPVQVPITVPTGNTTPTGNAVVVPAVNTVTNSTPTCNPNSAVACNSLDASVSPIMAWLNKYATYLGGSIILVLLAVYILMEGKEPKRKKR